ncbi:hypothetical protein [Novacetimonas hansenii]|uniref:hypothetical protein n=1 Tax=Novacetimonas hansenii TaxID=436 RepID=UPI001EF0068B|nr:hypothetical protein [Novacetimonas hansenii]
MEIEVTWIIHQYRITATQQQAADQVNSLRTRACQQNLIGADLQPFFSKLGCQEAAQAYCAPGTAIF